MIEASSITVVQSWDQQRLMVVHDDCQAAVGIIGPSMITLAVMIMLVELHSVVIIGPSMITAAVMIMLYDCRAAFRITLND